MEEIGLIIVLFAMFMFGAWCGAPGEDEIIVGSKSGYVCTDVRPATELDKRAECLSYELKEKTP